MVWCTLLTEFDYDIGDEFNDTMNLAEAVCRYIEQS